MNFVQIGRKVINLELIATVDLGIDPVHGEHHAYLHFTDSDLRLLLRGDDVLKLLTALGLTPVQEVYGETPST